MVGSYLVHNCAYGAGVDKIYENLTNDGVQISRDEVAAVHAGYWELFARVREYGYELQEGWWDTVDLPPELVGQYRNWARGRGSRDRVPASTTGYLLNGYGRPMCLTYDYRKDALNRFVQSTGHDTLVRYIYLVCTELTRRGVPWIPLVVDWHDSLAVEVPDEYVEVTKEIYLDSLDELNRQLGGRIRLKGTPSSGKNMTAIKEPES